MSRLDFGPLEDALVNLHVNVLEARINLHRAATVNPKEIEAECRSCGNRAAGVSDGEGLTGSSQVRACEPSMSVTGEDVGRGSSREGPRPFSIGGDR